MKNTTMYLAKMKTKDDAADLVRCYMHAHADKAEFMRFTIGEDSVIDARLDMGDMDALRAFDHAALYFRGAAHGTDPSGYLKTMRHLAEIERDGALDKAADILIEREF